MGLGVHWNSMVNTQLGDFIYENSFKPFTTLTNPVQVHWANSKVALSLFIGFQLHQHSTPEPWCLKKCMWVAERRGFFLQRLGWKQQSPNWSQWRKALSILNCPCLPSDNFNMANVQLFTIWYMWRFFLAFENLLCKNKYWRVTSRPSGPKSFLYLNCSKCCLNSLILLIHSMEQQDLLFLCEFGNIISSRSRGS